MAVWPMMTSIEDESDEVVRYGGASTHVRPHLYTENHWGCEEEAHSETYVFGVPTFGTPNSEPLQDG